MIEELQKKFVRVAMSAVSVLILGMLGAVNLLNYTGNLSQINREMERAVEMQRPPRDVPVLQRKDKEDGMFRFSQYFVVFFDSQGQPGNVDLTRAIYMEEEAALELAESIIDNGKEKGNLGNYRYCRIRLKDGTGEAVVFMDVSVYLRSNVRILVISLIIGTICWTSMLLLVKKMSRKAIRPIAKNIERQRRFVTNAGHEIKTPLAIMQANADALELHLGENKWTGNIKSQIVRLNGLMENLLLLSRMDETQIQFEKSLIPVGQLLSEEVGQYEELAAQKNITLEQSIDRELVWDSNKEGFLQIVSILMDNAIKYTNPNGLIKVILKKENRLQLIVENSCDDLPETEPETLFQRFYRGNQARTQKTGGYGIGLSVAFAIATSMKGEIKAEYIGTDTIRFVVEL